MPMQQSGYTTTCTQANGGGQHRYILALSERVFTDETLQKELEEKTKKTGCTIIPIIISSDKTQLTTFRGKVAYPVYLTIGNIPKFPNTFDANHHGRGMYSSLTCQLPS
jgi:hypothetical protein